MKIAGSTFIVTGGASGLGAATVRNLVGLGGHAVIADLNEQAGHALERELGASALFERCDVSSEADAKHAVTAAVQHFGALHGVVNCAGIATPGKVLGKEGPLGLDVFERVVRINLVGSFNLLRLAAEAMAKQEPNDGGERGVIINTASVAAFDGQIGQPAYAASKAGVVGMTLPAARELARFGIRVVTIAPGLFETPMMASLPKEAQESLGKSVPFPSRLGRPAEYAQLVQAIVENPMLNGETIRLDGALRMAPK
jgi:NAD(P)-dependent dehydrogenase (short-subunit alcohol dehydrogenase family)